MKTSRTHHYSLGLRITLVGGFLLSILIILWLRAASVQLVRGEQFRSLARNNAEFESLLPRQRGLLLDRFGQPLVRNRAKYLHLDNPDQLYSSAAVIDQDQALQLLATKSASVAYVLEREYVAGPSVAQVLGYTSPVSADDLVADQSLLMQDLIGKHGLEQQFERNLRGKPGAAKFSVNAFGQKQALLEETPSEPGQLIQTTIDPYLSSVAYQALSGQQGAVVIMDANTGAVLSLVSSPSFDPNVFSQVPADIQLRREREKKVAEQLADERKLFFNRASGGSYPPGSVFKIVTALAGLDSGAFAPEDTVLDEGVLKVGEYSYANWFFTQYGRTDGEIGVERALARSNDIFFYKAAEWVGPNRLAEYARRLWFGRAPSIELTSVATGLVPDVSWKEQTVGERWFLGNTYHFGIGQGDLAVSPLQVAQMTQAVANRGSLCPAHLLLSTEPRCEGLGFSDESLDVVVAGLLDACSAGGTGYPFFPWNELHRTAESSDAYQQVAQGAVACKTGTAEFGGQDERGFRSTHGWFTLFVDLRQLLDLSSDTEQMRESGTATDSAAFRRDSDSQSTYTDRERWVELLREHEFPTHLVITVLVESDEAEPYKEGSRNAAPVALDILEWMVGRQMPTIRPGSEQAVGD